MERSLAQDYTIVELPAQIALPNFASKKCDECIPWVLSQEQAPSYEGARVLFYASHRFMWKVLMLQSLCMDYQFIILHCFIYFKTSLC